MEEQDLLLLLLDEGKRGPNTLISDSFNRADGALGTTDSGQVWINVLNSISIVGNQASSNNTSQCIAVIPSTGYPQATISATISGTTSTPSTGIIFRYADLNNYFVLYANGSVLTLDRFVAGGFDRPYGGATVNQNDVISAVVSATSIIIKINGTTITTLSNSEIATNSGYGMRIYTGSAGTPGSLDDFSVVGM